MGVLVIGWEDSFDGIFEHEIACSSGDISDAIGDVSSPE